MRANVRLDVLECSKCKGRMKLVAVLTEPRSVLRFLASLGESTDVSTRSPNRGLSYWKSKVLRQKAMGGAFRR
ncbi:MAG: hypothetical protein L6Q76_13290 [Polyangiaceae bacterium]|nr:hypothetical protein [Polyangiaceae bacterium]